MSAPRLLVIGGSGDVGRGIASMALDRGWSVTAVGRDQARLDALSDELRGLSTFAGDVSTGHGVEKVVARADPAVYSAVIVTVNPGWEPAPLLGSPYELAANHVDTYLRAHLLCASGFIPAMKPGSTFIGIGGGMADATFSGMGAVSVAQAGQRAAYRHLAREARTHGIRVRELVIHSMVAGASNRAGADAAWLTDTQVGAAVCDLVIDDGERRNPIVDLAPES